MIELGLVPAFTGNELRKMLDSLDESESRKTKRKFRKMWKKLLKSNPELRDSLTTNEKGSDPSKSLKRNRSVIVTSRIVSSVNV
jgi:hypothetical protein